MTASTKRRPKPKPAPQTDTTPQLSCEVCHIPGDDTGDGKTLKNHGTETLPYYMCVETPGRECDKRAGIIRDVAIAEDEAQAVEGTAEEPAEVSQ